MIPATHQEDILFFAFRYCLGRKTYAVSTVVEAIIYSWPHISARTKRMMKREIVDYKNKNFSVGHLYIDDPEWMKILVLED